MNKKYIPILKPYLLTRSLIPENQETPIHFLRLPKIPRQYVYRRNHFHYPELTQDSFSITFGGEVLTPKTFSYNELLKMPSKILLFPLECSGNRREYFKPKVYGEQWKDGAISQGEWKGVSLNYLLSFTGIKPDAVEILFEGYDKGQKPGYNEILSFKRSLPLPKAFHPDTIIAYEYNGRPIPYKNGFPLRLIVPQWYAMASVKWLKSVTVIPYKFEGPFQTDDYVYYPSKEVDTGRSPVTTINTSSLIQKPLDYAILDTGTHIIDGIAWTGQGNIQRVELSFDEGNTWVEAEIYQHNEHPYSWVFWNYKWKAEKKGEFTIMSRAYDSYGRVQPLTPEWNRKGYGYNAVYTINVRIE